MLTRESVPRELKISVKFLTVSTNQFYKLLRRVKADELDQSLRTGVMMMHSRMFYFHERQADKSLMLSKAALLSDGNHTSSAALDFTRSNQCNTFECLSLYRWFRTSL